MKFIEVISDTRDTVSICLQENHSLKYSTMRLGVAVSNFSWKIIGNMFDNKAKEGKEYESKISKEDN